MDDRADAGRPAVVLWTHADPHRTRCMASANPISDPQRFMNVSCQTAAGSTGSGRRGAPAPIQWRLTYHSNHWHREPTNADGHGTWIALRRFVAVGAKPCT